MARRSRLPRRRPEGIFRLGQARPAAPAANLDEQRLTLYLPPTVLDWAEAQAIEAGVSTVQIYCANLLREAIESAHERGRVAEAEARQGTLAGFRAIEDDPEYLAEWSASVAPAASPPHDIHVIEAPTPSPNLDMPDRPPSAAAQVVFRHAASGSDDRGGFLPTLRRGETIVDSVARELMDALHTLEIEHQGVPTIDRRLAYALHRLAYEGQVLHTDAYPGQLDGATVDALRLVQEAVDRVLSGEDIRYFAPEMPR
ncbi:hypothetical protein TA3x_003418 [Tundrisphaera sp. TA3]|uniref:hypothetical protein n=1 Tax=Tundrisphaera sp. TA3 TaxID=3435775 RepID=UPI003EBF93C1